MFVVAVVVLFICIWYHHHHHHHHHLHIDQWRHWAWAISGSVLDFQFWTMDELSPSPQSKDSAASSWRPSQLVFGPYSTQTQSEAPNSKSQTLRVVVTKPVSIFSLLPCNFLSGAMSRSLHFLLFAIELFIFPFIHIHTCTIIYLQIELPFLWVKN